MGRRARADTSSSPGWKKNLALLVLGVVGAGDLDETGVLPLLFLDRFRENPQCANLKASCEKGPNRAPRSTSGAFAAFHTARVQSARSITITDPSRSTALVSSKLRKETAWARIRRNVPSSRSVATRSKLVSRISSDRTRGEAAHRSVRKTAHSYTERWSNIGQRTSAAPPGQVVRIFVSA